MKKLLGISVIAALAVLPMAGYAAVTDADPGATVTENAQMATNSPKYGLAQAHGTDGNLATAGYVKGAYNAAIKAVNKLSDDTDTKIGDMEGLTGDATTLVGAIEEVRAAASGDTGDLDDLTTTNKDSVVDAINELDEAIDTLNGSGAGSVDKKIEDNAANATYDNTTSLLTGDTIQEAIDELASEKQEKSDSTVANGTYNYIQQGSGVAANLILLDTATDANADAITVLNGDASTNGSVAKQIADAVSNLNTTLGDDYATKTGTLATINASTVNVMATWGENNPTVTTVQVHAPNTYQTGAGNGGNNGGSEQQGD